MRGLFFSLSTTVLALALLCGAGVESAQADYILGTEDPVNGFVGAITNPQIGPLGGITVASDGEAGFQPFGSSYDVSDAIQFSSFLFQPDLAATPAAFAPGFWQTQPGIANTWFLPAVTPGGTENEPSSEPPAQFFFAGGFWVPAALGNYDILEQGGGLSDVLVIANNGPGGTASIKFYSDPNFPGSAVPEPSSLTLLALGISGLAGYSWRRRKTAAA